VGIELDAPRAAVADALRRAALGAGLLAPAEAARLSLRQGDAFADGAFADATHVYMCSTTWPDSVFGLFFSALAANGAAAARRSSSSSSSSSGGGEAGRPPPPLLPLRWVLSTRAIPRGLLEQRNAGELARVGLRLRLHEVMVVPTSWTERCHLHVYALVQRPAGKSD
jgi:hypothetical protein